jgi:hypothetical protein
MKDTLHIMNSMQTQLQLQSIKKAHYTLNSALTRIEQILAELIPA